MSGSSERVVIVVNGRVLEIPAYHPTGPTALENSVAWWESVVLLGVALVVLGVLVGADLGSVAAVGGVALFLATGIVAGAERYEAATALGVAAVLWTSAGISVSLGVDPSLIGSLVAFATIGAVVIVAGSWGAARRRAQERNGSRHEN